MKRKGKGRRLWLIPLIGMPVLTVALSILCAKLILSGLISETGYAWCAVVIAGVVSFLVSAYSALVALQKKFMWGVATAITYGCLLLLGNLLFFGEGYGSNVPSVCCAVILCGILGTLLGAAKRRKNA